MHLFNQPMHSNSSTRMIALVVAICIVAAAAISFYPFFKNNGEDKKNPAYDNREEYYPAPLGASQIPGNPTIIPAKIKERPQGFPADLPLYEEIEIVQAYRTERPASPSYGGTVVYTTSLQPKDVIEKYASWFADKSLEAKLITNDTQSSLYLDANANLYNILAVRNGDQTIVTVGFTDTDGDE